MNVTKRAVVEVREKGSGLLGSTYLLFGKRAVKKVEYAEQGESTK